MRTLQMILIILVIILLTASGALSISLSFELSDACLIACVTLLMRKGSGRHRR